MAKRLRAASRDRWDRDLLARPLGGLVASLTVAALVIAGCGGGGNPLQQSGGGSSQAPGGAVVIGSTNFTEQLILANMYAEMLKSNGVKTKTRLNLGSREQVFPALKSGEISVMPEYTGALLTYLNNDATVSKPAEVRKALRQQLPQGVVALRPAPAQNKDVLVATQQTAKKHNLRTVSDLKGVADQLVIGGPPELKTRAVGIPGYKRTYGLHFKDFHSLDAGGPLTTSALKQGDIDLARFFSTDPIIEKNGWVILKDDKNLVPAQNLIPVIRKDALTPKVKKTLNELSSHLTTEAISKLDGIVQSKKTDPAKVAHQWLIDEGLVKS